MAERRSMRWRILAVLLLALAATAAALPLLLSTAPFQGVVRTWLSRALGTTLAFEDVALSWRADTRFTGLSVVGHGRFAGEPLFVAETVTLGASFPRLLLGAAPLDLVAEGAELRVTRDTTGTVDWAVAMPRPARLEEVPRVELRDARVRVEDARRGTIAWLRDVAFELDLRRADAWRVTLDAKSETPDGRGALLVRCGRNEAGATNVEGAARGFDLQWYEPLLAGFVEGAELAGRLDLDLNVTAGPGPRFDATANGTMTGFRLLAPVVTGALPVHETILRCEGGLGLDLEHGVVGLDAFHLSSSFLELQGDGVLRLDDEGLVGDATVKFNAECSRTVRQLRPLLLAYAPFRNIAGHVEVLLRPKSAGEARRFELAVQLENFAVQPHERLLLPLGTSALHADVAWNPRAGRLVLDALRTEARWADSNGRLDVTWPEEGRPFALDADLSITAETNELASFLHRVVPGLPLSLYGPATATVRARVDDEELSAQVTLASEWFDLRVDHDRGGGRVDTYAFFGNPFRAALDVRAPAAAERPLEAATGSFELDAEKASIYRNDLEAVRIEGTIADGTAAVSTARARTFGGTIDAAGAFTFAGDAPGLRGRIEGQGIRVEDRFPSWFAACVAPVFAAEPAPFAVKNDLRMEGRLDLSADGRRLNEWLASLRGDGRVTFHGSEIDGSPLLEALVEPYGEPGPRKVDAIETVLTIEDGAIRSLPVVHLAGGRAISLAGRTDGYGNLDYVVPADAIFDPAFVAEHRDLLADGLFRIGGRFDRPKFQLPDPDAWQAAAREGRLEEKVRSLENP